MIYRVVKLEFSPEEVPVVKPLFEAVASKVRGANGCTHLEILFDLNTRGKVITYSYWEREEDLHAYRQSDFFRAFWSSIKPRFSRPAEAWSMERPIFLP